MKLEDESAGMAIMNFRKRKKLAEYELKQKNKADELTLPDVMTYCSYSNEVSVVLVKKQTTD